VLRLLGIGIGIGIDRVLPIILLSHNEYGRAVFYIRVEKTDSDSDSDTDPESMAQYSNAVPLTGGI
jgi:hypothetical protein